MTEDLRLSGSFVFQSSRKPDPSGSQLHPIPRILVADWSPIRQKKAADDDLGMLPSRPANRRIRIQLVS